MEKILPHTIPDYEASCARALADLIAFRRLHGLNEDPFASTLTVQPSQVLAMQQDVELREAGVQ